MYILKRLSPAKIQIQICLKLQSSKAAESSEQHRKLAIDLGANLVLNCDRCHDAGVYHAKPRSLPVPIGPGAGHRLDTHTHTPRQRDRQSVGRSVRLAGDRRLAIADQPVSCGTRTWPTAQLTTLQRDSRDRGPGPASCLSHSPCSVPALLALPCVDRCLLPILQSAKRAICFNLWVEHLEVELTFLATLPYQLNMVYNTFICSSLLNCKIEL